MIKLLVLGGHGMAGHVIVDYFKKVPEFEVEYTSRSIKDKEGIFLEATDFDYLGSLIMQKKPDYIINCIGLLNEQASVQYYTAIQINSLLPHFIAQKAGQYGGKVIHISTDCVFSGSKGNYTENDIADGSSPYARTKYLGEIHDGKHLTIRTSIIGPELKNDGIGLFNWFMKQQGRINGYKKVYWNGVTTLQLAKVIHQTMNTNVTGLYHLHAPTSISKHDLLLLLQKNFQKSNVTVLSDENFVQDRTIKNTRSDYRFDVPQYDVMIRELFEWMKSNGKY